MSIFTEHKTVADRSASDRRRHKQKIEKAIKDGLSDIVAEESIIGKDGKKKIRIPVRGIKEYRFVYGDNKDNQRVGSAPGKEIRRGQKIGKADQKSKQPGGKPGNEAGEEYYDVEITLEELAKYLFDDLELPDLAKKSLKKIETEKIKRSGYRPKGIMPRLDKKKTAISRIKRKKAASRRENFDEEEKFSFVEDDLTFRHFKNVKKPCSNAAIFFLMDISGSMTKTKKFMARSFYFLLYHFIRTKYENTEVVFVAHDSSAREVSEDQFFTKGNSGGTLVSSGVNEVLHIIEQRFHPSNWNIYCFQCSDGDNWPDDTDPTIMAMEKLKAISQLVGYCEIIPTGERDSWSSEWKLSNIYLPLIDNKFKMSAIKDKSDIWKSFRKMFAKRTIVGF
jgi:sporulation protein YhbH